jgi:hypothetical protein
VSTCPNGKETNKQEPKNTSYRHLLRHPIL